MPNPEIEQHASAQVPPPVPVEPRISLTLDYVSEVNVDVIVQYRASTDFWDMFEAMGLPSQLPSLKWNTCQESNVMTFFQTRFGVADA
jgi:hypothetical protein